MKRKTIIVDDEKMARILLNGIVEEHCPNLEVVELCVDIPSAVKAIIKHQPELILLDIEMPGHNGLQLLDFFDDEQVNFSIIFITAYNKYATQAFKLSAIDYLLKPIDPLELVHSVQRFEKQKTDIEALRNLKNNLENPSSDQKLAVYTINSIKYIPLRDIAVFQAEGSYTQIILSDGQKLLTSKGLKHYEDLLSNHNHFVRCQKSFIVNLTKTTEYIKSEGGYLVVNNDLKIPVSSDKTQLILSKIEEIHRVL